MTSTESLALTSLLAGDEERLELLCCGRATVSRQVPGQRLDEALFQARRRLPVNEAADQGVVARAARDPNCAPWLALDLPRPPAHEPEQEIEEFDDRVIPARPDVHCPIRGAVLQRAQQQEPSRGVGDVGEVTHLVSRSPHRKRNQANRSLGEEPE